jgi:hypothetical protein
MLRLSLGCYVAIAGSFVLVVGVLATAYLRLTDRIEASEQRVMQKLDDHDLTSSCRSASSASDSTIRSLSAAHESLAGARLESLFLHAPH